MCTKVTAFIREYDERQLTEYRVPVVYSVTGFDNHREGYRTAICPIVWLGRSSRRRNDTTGWQLFE